MAAFPGLSLEISGQQGRLRTVNFRTPDYCCECLNNPSHSRWVTMGESLFWQLFRNIIIMLSLGRHVQKSPATIFLFLRQVARYTDQHKSEKRKVVVHLSCTHRVRRGGRLLLLPVKKWSSGA